MVESSDRQIRPDRVAMYIRWSTEEQGDGTTLADQREGCEFYVRSQGWFINPELIFIDDGYSGGNLDRPGMAMLRDLVQKRQVDCVVVLKIDRLSRNIVDAVHLVLEEWKEKCHLRCVRQPIDTTSETGRMFFSILATFADFERAQITERTYGGRLRRIQEGKAYGSPITPYGLALTEEPGVRALDPAKASIVAEMFRKVLEERIGTNDLLRWLEETGAPPPEADKWNLNTVRRILKNPIYMGKLVYGKVKHIKQPGKKATKRLKREEPLVVSDALTVPAIVTPEVFEGVQLILSKRTDFHAKHRRAGSSVHLLSGIARCRCGATMNIHWANGVRSYICSGRIISGSAGCPAENGTLLADKVEETVVLDALELYHSAKQHKDAAQKTLSAASAKQIELIDQERERLGKEVARLDEVLAEFLAQAGRGELPLAEWRMLRETNEAAKSDCLKKIAELEARKSQYLAEMTQDQGLWDRMQLLDRWYQLGIQEQKDLLRDLVEEIELFKPRGHRQEYQVTATWRFSSPENPLVR